MLVTMEGCCCSHRGKEAIGHESHDVDHCVFDIVIVSSRRVVVDVAVVKNLFNCSNLPGSCRGVFGVLLSKNVGCLKMSVMSDCSV